jgi:STE24 endopeptidase
VRKSLDSVAHGVERAVITAETVVNSAVPIPVTLPIIARFYPRADLVWVGTQLFALAIPLVVLASGASPRLRALCERVAGGRRYWVVTIFACLYLVLAAVVTLPVGYFADILFRRAWHGPTPTTVQWLASQGVVLLRECVLAAALVWIPYTLMRRAPRTWWLWATAVLVPLLTVALGIYQLVLTPLWTPYRKPDTVLAGRFEALAARCGVPHVPIYLFSGPGETVIGVGPFRRILVTDDPNLSRDEQVVLFAHELKHYLLDDTWKPIVMLAGLLITGLWLVHVLGSAAIRVFRRRLGFSELSDPASFPLAVFVLSLSWLVIGLPLFNTVSRHIELEADRFALELTHLNRAEGLAQLYFSKYQLNEYYWFYRIWRADHPSSSERVRLANTYHPWTTGKPSVYRWLCRMP